MNQFSQQIEEILKEPNYYKYDINYFCNVLSYIPYFQDAQEPDYIKYHADNTFEYTPELYSFITALFDSGIVEDQEEMTSFLDNYDSPDAYNQWVKEMNDVLNNDALLGYINISFVRKAFFTFIRLEKLMPGSWGIDVETGNWLKLLQQMKRILPEIYKPNRKCMN